MSWKLSKKGNPCGENRLDRASAAAQWQLGQAGQRNLPVPQQKWPLQVGQNLQRPR
jgi:hypothetical protein